METLTPKRFMRDLSGMDLVFPFPTSGSYTGPGDVQSGWTLWAGLRAYSAASIGGNCVDIIRASDSTTQTFKTVAGGGVDLAGITTFLNATTGKISKLYDQTGNTHDLIQPIGANQPAFTFNAIGSLPGITFASGSSTSLSVTSGLSLALPLSLMAIGSRSANGGFGDFLCGNSNNFIGGTSTANRWRFVPDGSVNTNISGLTDGSIHGFVGTESSGSDIIYADAVSPVSGTGTGATLTAHFFGGNAGIGFVSGLGFETGVHPTQLGATPAANLISNAKTYWGY